MCCVDDDALLKSVPIWLSTSSQRQQPYALNSPRPRIRAVLTLVTTWRFRCPRRVVGTDDPAAELDFDKKFLAGAIAGGSNNGRVVHGSSEEAKAASDDRRSPLDLIFGEDGITGGSSTSGNFPYVSVFFGEGDVVLLLSHSLVFLSHAAVLLPRCLLCAGMVRPCFNTGRA